MQKGYLKKVLQKLHINGDTKSVSTPLTLHFKLKGTMSLTSIENHEYMIHVPCASAIGSLIYTMVCTRSDLSQAVSVVSSYMHDPGRGHWEAVKWILRYIKGTINVGLVFKKDFTRRNVSDTLIPDVDNHRSTTGCVYIIPSTSQLVLYSIIYCRIVYYRGPVYGHDGVYEGGNLTSRVTWHLGDWSRSIEDQLW